MKDIHNLLIQAQKGEARAQLECGAYYLHGRDKDLGRAEYWFRKAAEQGLPEGQTALAYVLETFHKRPQEAVIWLKRAAVKGHPDALYRMAVLGLCQHATGMEGEQALHYLQQASAQGHAEAAELAAFCLHVGRGTAVNRVQAAQAFNQALKHGSVAARLCLAQWLEQGHGLEPEPVSALRAWQEVAEQHPQAQPEAERLAGTLRAEERQLAERMTAQQADWPRLQALPARTPVEPVWSEDRALRVDWPGLAHPLLCANWVEKYWRRPERKLWHLPRRAHSVRLYWLLDQLAPRLLQTAETCQGLWLGPYRALPRPEKGPSVDLLLLPQGRDRQLPVGSVRITIGEDAGWQGESLIARLEYAPAGASEAVSRGGHPAVAP